MSNLHPFCMPQRQWLLLLIGLLLLNQWTTAFASSMQLPAASSHLGIMMSDTQPAHTPACEEASGHGMQMSHASTPTSPDHCSNPSACQLCHATPALLSLDAAAIIRPAKFTPRLPHSFYLSVTHAALDRPPANLLA